MKITTDGKPIFILQQPPRAGCWVIGNNFRVYVERRPRWLARWLMRVLLEWQWEDA